MKRRRAKWITEKAMSKTTLDFQFVLFPSPRQLFYKLRYIIHLHIS